MKYVCDSFDQSFLLGHFGIQVFVRLDTNFSTLIAHGDIDEIRNVQSFTVPITE